MLESKEFLHDRKGGDVVEEEEEEEEEEDEEENGEIMIWRGCATANSNLFYIVTKWRSKVKELFISSNTNLYCCQDCDHKNFHGLMWSCSKSNEQ